MWTKVGLLLVALTLVSYGLGTVVKADECDSPGSLTDPAKIDGCIGKFGGILDAISRANATNQKELQGLQDAVALQNRNCLDQCIIMVSKRIS